MSKTFWTVFAIRISDLNISIILFAEEKCKTFKLNLGKIYAIVSSVRHWRNSCINNSLNILRRILVNLKTIHDFMEYRDTGIQDTEYQDTGYRIQDTVSSVRHWRNSCINNSLHILRRILVNLKSIHDFMEYRDTGYRI